MKLGLLSFLFLSNVLGGLCFIDLEFPTFLLEHTARYRDPLVDEEKVVCEGIQVPDPSEHEKFYKLKSNFTGPLEYEDVIRMTAWNMKRGFRYRNDTFQLDFPKDNWRKRFLDDIFDIFKTGCDNAYVPHEFLNIIYEFVMIYCNNVTPKINENEEKWNATSYILEDCKMEMPSLLLHDVTLSVVTMNLAGDDITLLPPKEMADSIPDMDIIVDTLWWLFSFSFGSCYYPAGYRSTWAAKYRKIFYEDYLHPLEMRWTNAGPHANFGVIFGNFDLTHILDNIRMCVTATYTKFGIADMQLVRPILIGPYTENFKTGGSWMDDNGL